MAKRVAAIIVTHNSSDVLGHCVEALESQSIPLTQIIIVDCGSSDSSYLSTLEGHGRILISKEKNIGFSKANNRGIALLNHECDFILFINPDLFLSVNFVENMLACYKRSGLNCVMSGRLLGYDIEKGEATGLIDSTGVFRKWYGRWYDRGQGEKDCGQYAASENVPALCGALLCMPAGVVKKLGDKVFQEDFFLYKEDIELSLRLRKKGSTLIYDPELVAYHCRGWNTNRGEMSYSRRLLAAESELILYKHHPSVYGIFALLKYLLVKVFKV